MISPTSNREYLEFTNPVEYTDAFEDSKVSRAWSVTTLLFGISIVFSRKKEVSSVGTNSARGIMSPDHMANLGQAKFQNTIFIIHYIVTTIIFGPKFFVPSTVRVHQRIQRSFSTYDR